MFKSFQDTSALQQFHSFPNLNMQQATSAYGFSGVTFWLDAAYGLNTQTNLGAVSRWQARVGGSVFEQATAGSQPRLILSDANYNNLPSVESVSNARFMQSDPNLGLKYNGNNTIAVISKVNTINLANGIIGRSETVGWGINDGGSVAGANGFSHVFNGTLILQGTTETNTTRIKIITNTNVIINGSNETTGTNTIQTTEYFNLFRTQNATAGNLIGSIAEIICFGYSMTSDEAIALSNNINQKYALY
ncbi:hypothetical protein UFOVP318_43 [uncultured Caudovirales phage]|uniref:Uncharacterized protein n=1 Tax=uncultured Caudovirales phage TaxID=2100421 RepID=A0A6J5LTY7_9CAUD|nr:hypothetical protein UFOVP318_43 [uncultured Caudovirales phage]